MVKIQGEGWFFSPNFPNPREKKKGIPPNPPKIPTEVLLNAIQNATKLQ